MIGQFLVDQVFNQLRSISSACAEVSEELKAGGRFICPGVTASRTISIRVNRMEGCALAGSQAAAVYRKKGLIDHSKKF
jgi:hypothetical protein